MRCRKLHDLLDAAQDRGQPLSEDALLHLVDCQACQHRQKALLRLRHDLTELPLPLALPSDFAARVVARLRTEIPLQSTSPWESFLFAARRLVMGAACALALASVFAIWTNQFSSVDDSALIAQVQSVPLSSDDNLLDTLSIQ